jgi:hypothetical protein
MRRKPITADELMAQLEADPEYKRQRHVRESEWARREEELKQDEAGLVAEVRALGYDIDSVWDLVNNSPHPVLPRRFVGPYERAYPTLVSHLDAPHHPRVREGIIRALTVKDGGQLVQDSLYEQFERERDRSLRWVLANALRTAMPYRLRCKHPAIGEVWRLGGASRE